MKKGQKKNLLKTLSWRIIATSTTLLLAYLMTGQLEVVKAIGVSDVFLKTAIYFFHERTWNGIHF
jgi:adenylylsulfate kinase